MYAIGFINIGSYGMQWSAGSNGMMKIYHKSSKYIMDDTRIMRNLNDEVYLVKDLTQEMLEMNSARFYDAVRAVGQRLK